MVIVSPFDPWAQTLTFLISTINHPAIESLYAPIKENGGLLEVSTTTCSALGNKLCITGLSYLRTGRCSPTAEYRPCPAF
jgi:hypothetical protein